MGAYIVKLTQTEGQTRLTIPKTLAEETGLAKVLVVEVWKTEKHIIHVKEWDGEKRRNREGSKS